jgi:hypothetical protein
MRYCTMLIAMLLSANALPPLRAAPLDCPRALCSQPLTASNYCNSKSRGVNPPQLRRVGAGQGTSGCTNRTSCLAAAAGGSAPATSRSGSRQTCEPRGTEARGLAPVPPGLPGGWTRHGVACSAQNPRSEFRHGGGPTWAHLDLAACRRGKQGRRGPVESHSAAPRALAGAQLQRRLAGSGAPLPGPGQVEQQGAPIPCGAMGHGRASVCPFLEAAPRGLGGGPRSANQALRARSPPPTCRRRKHEGRRRRPRHAEQRAPRRLQLQRWLAPQRAQHAHGAVEAAGQNGLRLRLSGHAWRGREAPRGRRRYKEVRGGAQLCACGAVGASCPRVAHAPPCHPTASLRTSGVKAPHGAPGTGRRRRPSQLHHAARSPRPGPPPAAAPRPPRERARTLCAKGRRSLPPGI